jgi:putative ABC transport system ATP-binding protein
MQEASGSRSDILSLRDVSYSFPTPTGRKQVLRNVSADIWPGEIALVVGPSGSGKTTMLTLAGALRSVESGSIVVLRQELAGASPRELRQVRKKIGFIFQSHNLLNSLSVLDNVRTALMPIDYPARHARQDCIAMLRAVGLGEHIHSRPRNLSGGQRQRVAIARALVRKPELVLADEPTASLDGASGREVVELLRELARAQGCSIAMVTHDNRILDLADNTLRLEDGELSSYASALTADSSHMLTALSGLGGEEMDWFWGEMADAKFMDVLRKLRSESMQYLNVLDFGSEGAKPEWIEALLQSLLRKVATVVGAAHAVIRTAGRTPRQFALEIGGLPDASSAAPSTCEIHDRDEGMIGVAEFHSKENGGRLSAAGERRLRDFERPLGLLLEICIRARSSQ